MLHLRSKDIINLLYEGVKIINSFNIFFFDSFKIFYYFRINFYLLHDQNHNKELRHQDLIYFLSCHVILQLLKTMEININCDLGEKSKHHSNKHDPDLLQIVNSANVACGYHAGDEESMNQVVQISKKNGVVLVLIHLLMILKILEEKE